MKANECTKVMVVDALLGNGVVTSLNKLGLGSIA